MAAVGRGRRGRRAQRARDLGDDEARRRALLEADFHLGRVGAAAEDGGPVEEAWLRSAEAEHARAAGQADAGAARGRGRGVGGASSAPIPPRSCAGARARRTSPPGDRDAATRGRSSARTRSPRASAPAGCAARSRASPPARAWPSPAPTARPPSRCAPAVAQEDPFGLTPRERQVLALVAEGRTNREIGDSLFMAEKTASVHVSRILAKLDVRSRTEAAAVAHRLGLDGDVAATRPA